MKRKRKMLIKIQEDLTYFRKLKNFKVMKIKMKAKMIRSKKQTLMVKISLNLLKKCITIQLGLLLIIKDRNHLQC